MDVNAIFVVEHPAAQPVCVRQTIGERPESDSLHDTAHTDKTGEHSRAAGCNNTTPALPSDLNYFAVFDQHWNGSLTFRKCLHALQCIRICFDIIFHELAPFEIKPVA
jgi:hypothetical protein